MSRILAIVGRPNVGKSTFFNRLTQTREAIVDPTSGVTRDRHYGRSEWNGLEFSVIDTGGYISDSGDIFQEEICRQVRMAIEEADAIVFLVDAKEGLTAMDEVVSDILRRSEKPVFLAANKMDNPSKVYEVSEFYRMGLGEVYPMSSINGSGTGELLDEVVAVLASKKDEPIPDLPRFAIVGRPNVGKSTLVNALLGEERNIVTPIAGTTRDSIFTRYNKYGHDFLLVDTAGIRKKAKVKEDIEFYSVMRSIRSIEQADVCLLLIDATQGIEAQDINIFHIIQRNNKGVLIVVNKWDLIEKQTNSVKEFTDRIHNALAPFRDVPVLFISAINKQRIHKVLAMAATVHANRQHKIPGSNLNDVMLEVIDAFPPPMVKGKQVKIKYVSQLPAHYPSFVFFCNLPQYIREDYKRYLENKLREHFNFSGVPLTLYFRKK